MKLFRILLLPFSWVYGLVVAIRNFIYDVGWKKQTSFDLPVIVVGNLDVGGSGKTPMTEYLIRLLKDKYKLATLSRGYGRKTSGYIEAGFNASASQIGDEPAQFKQKFPEITVAVCESRVTGVSNLKKEHELVLLDDAFQHRALQPGFSLVLFEYSRVFKPHWLLPAGNLRESFNGRKRADMLVVSKCPPMLKADEQERILKRLKPYPHQQVFFTSIQYGPLEDLSGNREQELPDAETTVYLLTGIANPKPLWNEIAAWTSRIRHHNYPDHHQFSLKNITKLVSEFEGDKSLKKIIVTTEKDAQRLREQDMMKAMEHLPLFVQPIAISFLNNSADQFDHLINNYARKYTTHH
jgi:tetraacyldisaccharide 4'-kinase